MKKLQKIFLLITVLGLCAVNLSSCGRYSEPSPIESSGFPHQYPQH
ncbi:MAG: hypothetical protein J6Y91_02910 [Alphaproteobacteria bacterium]|nr:hypothetical protein [Alphaproteobacteria bacterium]